MGGDDLDDEAWLQPIGDDHSDDRGEPEVEKRKLEEVDHGEKSAKRRKSPEKMMIEAGRGIESQPREAQATFLTTFVKHHSISSLEGGVLLNDQPFKADSFVDAPEEGTFANRLRALVSVKRLKKWSCGGSPCIIVMCISARRAVAILKELSTLKCRIAKLFPKNGSAEQQRSDLQRSTFPIAVGTPHRLAFLSGCKGYEGDQALNFSRTALFVIDASLSNKMFSVLTLPDTAPHCAALLRDAVLPQLRKRQQLKIAFL